MRALSSTQRRIEVSADSRYLTIGQVRERFGVSDMWVWRHMRDHDFPKPIQFGGPTSARHWLISDIEHWERDRVRQNRAPRPLGTGRSAEKIMAPDRDTRGGAP